jgi:putative intracellular protease/amidase
MTWTFSSCAVEPARLTRARVVPNAKNPSLPSDLPGANRNFHSGCVRLSALRGLVPARATAAQWIFAVCAAAASLPANDDVVGLDVGFAAIDLDAHRQR